MNCPVHKDVELIQNVLGGLSGGTYYHCYKCHKCGNPQGIEHGGWSVTELVKKLSRM